MFFDVDCCWSVDDSVGLRRLLEFGDGGGSIDGGVDVAVVMMVQV